MALGHVQIGEHVGNEFRGHRASAIGMNSEIRRIGALLADRRLQKRLCKLGAFTIGHHPGHDVAAITIVDRVERKIRPFSRTMQFGDIPSPHAIRSVGDQLRLDMRLAHRLIAALANFAEATAHAVHRRNRSVEMVFNEQRDVDVRYAAIDKALLMDGVKKLRAFLRRRRARRPAVGLERLASATTLHLTRVTCREAFERKSLRVRSAMRLRTLREFELSRQR